MINDKWDKQEWLVTNGIGGYASGTVTGELTRRYHGLLVAALQPPLGRTLLLSKLDETVNYQQQDYPLFTNCWLGGIKHPHGDRNLKDFHQEGTTPVWTFSCGDAVIEKRIWMELSANTTYVQYQFHQGKEALSLSLKALVNYRDYHGDTHNNNNWEMAITAVERGVCLTAFPDAIPFYLLTDRGKIEIHHDWYKDFYLSLENYRGLGDHEDHLHAATFNVQLNPGESFTFIATSEYQPNFDSQAALVNRRRYEQNLLDIWHSASYLNTSNTPPWLEHLVLAADQFIVGRNSEAEPEGKTIIAGYHWFSDWGRDTAISLPGLTIATGRFDVAKTILRTFSHYLDQGMLPNVFPDGGNEPHYNTVDAIFWYFEAVRAYYEATADDSFLAEIFPALAEVVDWHRRGTRYNIHLDSQDGLIYAGEAGVQLTWMDAKVGDWVVTPRVGKPVEINALWYNALIIMGEFAQKLGKSSQEYEKMAGKARQGFQRFWAESLGYCYDLLDTPDGNDSSLRPNQIFAVSLPVTGQPLLKIAQQKRVVDQVREQLLTPYGLRSLSPLHPQYQGRYGGDQYQRDSAYHQGTAWAWLIGHFIQAHLKVYSNSTQAQQFLKPIAEHLLIAGRGTISEIFDGDSPHTPRGCIAQAWSVAEVLRVWQMIV